MQDSGGWFKKISPFTQGKGLCMLDHQFALFSKAFIRLASLFPALRPLITFLAGDCNNPIISPIMSCLLLRAVKTFNWLSPAKTSPSIKAAFKIGFSRWVCFLKEVIIRAGSFAFSEKNKEVTHLRNA